MSENNKADSGRGIEGDDKAGSGGTVQRGTGYIELIRFLTESKVLKYKDSEYEIELHPMAFFSAEDIKQAEEQKETPQQELDRKKAEMEADLYWSSQN